MASAAATRERFIQQYATTPRGKARVRRHRPVIEEGVSDPSGCGARIAG